MSVSGPSPLGTLMVQRVEGALGATVSQQANIATGARPDAVTQPGQPDKTDPTKNPPPKEQDGSRQAQGRQGGLAALGRNNPEILKLLAARNAPMTGYTASAPTSLGQAAKTILALFQQMPDARPAVTGRAPLLSQAPGQPPAPHTGTRAAPATTGSTTTTQAVSGQAGAARSAAPMAGGLPPASSGLVGQLAQALSQAMQGSGLFYESHLREFAFGQRSLAQMQAEPQAQAGRETQTPAQNTTAQNSPAQNTATQNPAAQARGGETTGQAGQAAANTASPTPQAGNQPAAPLPGLDPSTHALVRQQLETLANQSFAWQGEAWPGGDLEWEVRRRAPQETGDDAENWSTRLKLNLPGLGEVVARLSLSDSQVVMHLAAPDSAGLMAEHTGQLRERLGLHGLQLSQLSITRDSDTEPGMAP